MKFRDSKIDNILIVGPCTDGLLMQKLKVLAEEYNIIDLQYATQVYKNYTGHSALVLVRNKK